MMTKMELFVRQCVASEFGLDGCNTASLDLRFQEDLKADDLQMLAILMELEKSLAIEVPIDVFHSWKTVADVVNYLEGYYHLS